MSHGPRDEEPGKDSQLGALSRKLGPSVLALVCAAGLFFYLRQIVRGEAARDLRIRQLERQLQQLAAARDTARARLAEFEQQLAAVRTGTGSRKPSAGNQTEPDIDRAARAAADTAVRRLELGSLQSRIDDMDAQLATVREAATQWEVRLSSLRTDEAGRRLAARPDLVRQFAALTDKPRPSLPDIGRYREDIDILRTGLAEFFQAEVAALPGESFRDALAGVETAIRTAGRQSDSDRALLDALLAQVATLNPGAESLADALGKFEREQAAARARELAAARQQVLDAGIRELSQQEQQRIRAAIDLEIQNSQRATDADREKLRRELDRQAAEVAEAAAQREKERLKREALRPEVLELLAPLITPDDVQPRDIVGFGALAQTMPDKEPVSLRRLKMLGVLDRTEKGMQRLVLLNATDWTNRPRWRMKYSATEPELWNQLQKDTISKTQEYLIKYGDVLVEAGKLSP